MLDPQSPLSSYISDTQKSLISAGYHLLEDAKNRHAPITLDYSYVVFPFAKAYEGFLKQFFADLNLISQQQYKSEHFRVGKVLSPNLQKRLGQQSVYRQLCEAQGRSFLADELWRVWKRGRNQVFHYFPHNVASLTIPEAEQIIKDIIAVMELAVKETR